MKDEDMKKVSMELIMRSQGTGYLKVPKRIKDSVLEECGKSFTELASPELSWNIENGELKLVYSFDLDDDYDGEVKDEYISR